MIRMSRIMSGVLVFALLFAQPPVVSAQDGSETQQEVQVYLPMVNMSIDNNEPFVVASDNVDISHITLGENIAPDAIVLTVRNGNAVDIFEEMAKNPDGFDVQSASIFNGDWGEALAQNIVHFGSGFGQVQSYMKGRDGWFRFAPFKTGAYLDGYARSKVFDTAYDQLRIKDEIAINGISVSFNIGSGGGGLSLSPIQSNVLKYDSDFQDPPGREWTVNYTGIRFEGIGTSTATQTAIGTFRTSNSDHITSAVVPLPQ